MVSVTRVRCCALLNMEGLYEKLQGKIAIVTGSSRRSGIGTAICRALAAQGADIYFTHYRAYDRTMEWGEDRDWPEVLTELLQNDGSRAFSLEIDLADPNSPKRIMDEVIATLGAPTILVNNAAYSKSDGYQNLDVGILVAHYAVNVRGTCLLSVEFAGRIGTSTGGRIVNMVSGQDKGPMPGELAYAATKGAISAFAVSLAAELAPLNITVNAVDPGPTDTGWMTTEIKHHVKPKFPMGRIGVPEDIARLITFLASDDAQWITGQITHSDGGFRG